MPDIFDDIASGYLGAKATPPSNPYDHFIEDSAARYGVDPDLIRAQMHQESTGKPNALSPKGASGLMQLLPATARQMGVKNIYDPQQNIEGGVKYLKQQLDEFGGDVPLALAAYNSGPGAVKKYGNKIPPYKETQDYVKKITGKYQGDGTNAFHSIAENYLQNGTKPADAVDTAATEYLANGDKPTIPADRPLGSNGKPMMAPEDIKGGDTSTTFQKPHLLDNPTPIEPEPVKLSPLDGIDPTQLFGGNARVAPKVQGTPPQSIPGVSEQIIAPDAQADDNYPYQSGPVKTAIRNPTAPSPAVNTLSAKPQHTATSVNIEGVDRDPDTGEIIPAEKQPLQEVNANQADNAVAETIDIPDTFKTEDEALGFARKQLQAKYEQPFEKFKFLQKWEPGQSAQVTFKDLKGAGVDTDSLIREKVVENRVENPKPDLNVGKNWVTEDAEWLNSNAGQAVSAINPLLTFLPKETRDWLGASLVGGAAGAAARTANALEGTGELIGKLNPVLDAIATPFKGTLSEALKNAAETGSALEQKTGDAGFASTLVKTAGAAPGDLARLYLLTRVPLGGLGSSVVGMAADQGLQSAGRGDAAAQIAKETAIGGTIGALFGLAPIAGKFGSTIEGTLTNNTASKIVEEGLTAATIFGGTKVIDQLSGKPEDQATQSGIINALFHLSGIRKDQVLGNIVKATDADGNITKVKVTEKGLEPVPDNAKENIQMYFDKDATLQNRKFVEEAKFQTSEGTPVRKPDARDTGIPNKVEQDTPAIEAEIRKSTSDVERATPLNEPDKEAVPTTAKTEPQKDLAVAGRTNRVPLSNTQVEFSQEQAKPFEDFRKNVINPADVADKAVLPEYAKDGIHQIEPHITVKYGLHTNDHEDVVPMLKGEKPVEITLGKTGVFKGSEKKIPGTDKPVPYDVVTVEVESKDLAHLNKKLTESAENTTTFPYSPHITLAYVKSGEGRNYAGRTDFEGQKYTFDGVTFSPADKSGKKVIPLEGASEGTDKPVEASTPEITANNRPAITLDTRGGRTKVQYLDGKKEVGGVLTKKVGEGPNPWVDRAKESRITNIGQLKPADVKALDAAVKRGELVKGKGGQFGNIKTVYAKPGFDFEADRAEGLKEFKKAAAMDDLAARVRNLPKAEASESTPTPTPDLRIGDRVQDTFGRKGTVFKGKDGELHIEQSGTKARLPLSDKWSLIGKRPIEMNGLKKGDTVQKKDQIGKVYEYGGQLRVKWTKDDKARSEPLSEKWAKAVNSEAGSVDPSLLTLGLNKTISQDVAPAIRRAGTGLRNAIDDVRKVVFAGSRGITAELAGGSLRAELGKQARSGEIAQHALKDARKVFAKSPIEDNYDFIANVESGSIANLPPAYQPIATELRRLLDESRTRVQDLGTGKLENYIENYFPHIWDDPKKAQPIFSKMLSKRPFEGSKAFLKQRVYDTFQEGLDAGLTPVSDNPVDLALLKIRDMDKYVAAHNAINYLKGKGLAQFVKSGKPVPDGYIKIDDKISEVKYKNDVGEMVTAGHLYAVEPAATIINNYLSPGLTGSKYAGIRDGYKIWRYAGNLMNQAQLGLSAFHAAFTTIDVAISKTALGLDQIFSGHPIKGAKSMLEAPISPITNLVRGHRIMKEGLTPGSTDEDTRIIADLVAEAGGRFKMDDFYQTKAAQKMSDAFKKGNILGGLVRTPAGVLDIASRPLMQGLVPRQKLGVFAGMAKDTLARLGPDATIEQKRAALGKDWDSVDNRMGQLVYDNLFWNKTIKDLSMASVRSVGWNIGLIREGGGAVKDTLTLPSRVIQAFKAGKVEQPIVTRRMTYAVALPFVTGIIGATTMYLMTGKGPQELKDYFFPKTGNTDENGNDERLNLPTYMKDVYAYGKHPLKTLGHKAHPLIGMISEMLSNKDYYGTEIRHPDDPLVDQLTDVAKHVGTGFIPFSIQGLMKEKERQGTGASKTLSFFGFNPAPKDIDNTKAEDMLSEMAAEHREVGARTKAAAEKSQEIADLVRMKKRGQDEAFQTEFAKAKAAGIVIDKDLNTIKNRLSRTYMEAGVARLGIEDALKIYDVANDEERSRITDEMQTKIRNATKDGKITDAMAKHIKDLGLNAAPKTPRKVFKKGR